LGLTIEAPMSTPLMKQYLQVKARYPGTILLFRMGDFFETFEEDAKTTARVLGITLTKRGNGAAGEVPLAGFPHHALNQYLPRLLKAGLRVAVCEQMEDPRFAKGIVKRDVIEVVTPGVAFSDHVLEQKTNNYLAAIALPNAVAAADDPVGFAFADVTTAEFRVSEFPFRILKEQLGTLGASELLVQKRDMAALKELLGNAFTGLYTPIEDWIFHRDFARDLLINHFQTQSLKGFGIDHYDVGIIAAGAVLQYLQETQKANLFHLKRITTFDVGSFIVLDPSTKRNLEIVSSISGSTDGTLFGILDRTFTPMGGRLLKHWIHQPLNTVAPIQQRLDAVEELAGRPTLRLTLAEPLSQIGDLERLTTRICTARATPRDLTGLHGILRKTAEVQTALGEVNAGALREITQNLSPLPGIQELISNALEADPPLSLADGGVIRKGFHAGLDELRDLTVNGKQWIATLQQQERERTGINSLKVGYNNVFGYYIEITNTHKDRVPVEYIRKQTITNAERYITPALKEQEEKILHAEERMVALETSLFNDVRLQVAAQAEGMQQNAAALAQLDCLVSLATVAVEYSYVRPEVDNSTTMEIIGGRHPVIERLLPPGEQYVPNDLILDTAKDQILIITGPNMSGKSSYLRQVGLIVLLAQIGSYVPATRAVIGLVDKIFTRVGASDNIASGESTFLVEMHEAAHIVNSATSRSLILLDEVGRGTSTFDGISIAWSLTEYLHERLGARTLFATHYHEMNELADRFPRIRNYKVDVREYGDKVVFLHKVTPGAADHSYGIHVAKMAGLPEEITTRATAILHQLEGAAVSVEDKEGSTSQRAHLGDNPLQLTLFVDDPLREALKAVDVDRLTPLEALQLISTLKRKADPS
jgi:DNA mismatch repair protein MutS